jgi:predicted aconitase with swiveling domain
MIRARVILPGAASGRALKVAALSFWGGVDPDTGALTDPSIAHHGERVAGRVLFVAEPRGSSSSSAVMLELSRTGQAPSAIVLGRVDAILGLGIVVAREMGWPAIPLYELDQREMERIEDGAEIAIDAEGRLSFLRT